MRIPFTGVGTALITPFRKDGSIDDSTVRSLVRRQIDAGIHFVSPCGTTGEAPTLSDAEKLRVCQLVVKEEGGEVVRLGEIADVVLGAETYDNEVRFNGETAVFIGIWALPTANTLEVMQRVREAMPDIQAELPAGMKGGIPYDSTLYIEYSIREVLKTLSETLLIVILVIYL